MENKKSKMIAMNSEQGGKKTGSLIFIVNCSNYQLPLQSEEIFFFPLDQRL